MKLTDFSFELPEELIAKYPLENRTDSRLLTLIDNQYGDHIFAELPELLQPNDLLVFNNSKVMAARLYGHKATGGKVELLIERIVANQQALAHIKASKSLKPDSLITIAEGYQLQVIAKEEDLYRVAFPTSVTDCLDRYGHIPLPPYMAREAVASDQDRYQTVYHQHLGSAAAPTAGLHFDKPLLNTLTEMGIEQTFVTLHVGAGTFQPVRVDNITEHRMHSEWIEVSLETCDKIKQTKAKGGRVIAVGTTSVRCLETAAKSGQLKPFQGETDIFIYPGFEFQCIDAMITNFHLPESSLIMLVSAFIGLEQTKQLYQYAIQQKYRFYSYGDAMFLT